jgi:hypothetical protein
MTDKELLELAANAAGITGDWCRWHQSYGDEWVEGIDTGAPFLWNPLTDDGDALRLAVKLGIRFEKTDTFAVAWGAEKQFTEPLTNDPYAATRRAVTRAAAEIGKTK